MCCCANGPFPPTKLSTRSTHIAKVRLDRKTTTIVFPSGVHGRLFSLNFGAKTYLPLGNNQALSSDPTYAMRGPLKRVLDFLQEKVRRERAPTSVRFPPNLECKAQHKPSHEGPVPSLKNSPASHVATFFQSTRGGHARYFNRPAVTCTNV